MIQRVRSGDEASSTAACSMRLILQRSRQDRIQIALAAVRRHSCSAPMPVAPVPPPPAAARSSTRSAAAGDRRRRSAQRIRHQSGRNTAQTDPRPRPQKIRIRDIQVDARNRDVIVVLERQRHRIRQAQINLPVPQQRVQPRTICVPQPRLGYIGRRVGSDRIPEVALRLRIVLGRIHADSAARSASASGACGSPGVPVVSYCTACGLRRCRRARRCCAGWSAAPFPAGVLTLISSNPMLAAACISLNLTMRSPALPSDSSPAFTGFLSCPNQRSIAG